jgi:hypothetical protein
MAEVSVTVSSRALRTLHESKLARAHSEEVFLEGARPKDVAQGRVAKLLPGWKPSDLSSAFALPRPATAKREEAPPVAPGANDSASTAALRSTLAQELAAFNWATAGLHLPCDAREYYSDLSSKRLAMLRTGVVEDFARRVEGLLQEYQAHEARRNGAGMFAADVNAERGVAKLMADMRRTHSRLRIASILAEHVFASMKADGVERHATLASMLQLSVQASRKAAEEQVRAASAGRRASLHHGHSPSHLARAHTPHLDVSQRPKSPGSVGAAGLERRAVSPIIKEPAPSTLQFWGRRGGARIEGNSGASVVIDHGLLARLHAAERGIQPTAEELRGVLEGVLTGNGLKLMDAGAEAALAAGATCGVRQPYVTPVQGPEKRYPLLAPAQRPSQPLWTDLVGVGPSLARSLAGVEEGKAADAPSLSGPLSSLASRLSVSTFSSDVASKRAAAASRESLRSRQRSAADAIVMRPAAHAERVATAGGTGVLPPLEEGAPPTPAGAPVPEPSSPPQSATTWRSAPLLLALPGLRAGIAIRPNTSQAPAIAVTVSHVSVLGGLAGDAAEEGERESVFSIPHAPRYPAVVVGPSPPSRSRPPSSPWASERSQPRQTRMELGDFSSHTVHSYAVTRQTAVGAAFRRLSVSNQEGGGGNGEGVPAWSPSAVPAVPNVSAPASAPLVRVSAVTQALLRAAVPPIALDTQDPFAHRHGAGTGEERPVTPEERSHAAALHSATKGWWHAHGYGDSEVAETGVTIVTPRRWDPAAIASEVALAARSATSSRLPLATSTRARSLGASARSGALGIELSPLRVRAPVTLRKSRAF